TQELGSGALAFHGDMRYGVNDLNAISGCLIEKGVSHGCELSLSEGAVHIGEGVLFMPDGKRVTIDAEGIFLPLVPGETSFVWFSLDDVTGFVMPRVTDYAPGGAPHVMLGEVTAKGELVGYPDKAVMKHENMGRNYAESHSLSLSFTGDTAETLVAEIPLSHPGCQHLILEARETGSLFRCNRFSGYVDLSSGSAFGVLSTTPDLSGEPDWATVSLSENEGKLCVALCNYQGRLIHHKVMLRAELGADKVLRLYRSFLETGVLGAENLPNRMILNLYVC
ncbi:MAG: hypothetical protein IJO50_01945, partial [Clostridia bacterium]|nr:hypothetical protein [Clostridia bacterium]